MPSYSDGFWKATGDYAEGILKAPSTYVGLVLPGAGRSRWYCSHPSCQAAVNRTLARKPQNSHHNPCIQRKTAANPVKTAVLVEGTAGTLQNVTAQKARWWMIYVKIAPRI